ncbi:MAG: endonuclease III [Candidatus Thermoplasmatota archaeon]|nr:endonuclease III [Candidatus Thermoplasmatota archaeon]
MLRIVFVHAGFSVDRMASGHSGKLRRKAGEIDRILTRTYGRKEVELDDDPIDTLVETILSQNTTDVNSHKAFRELKRAYPSWNRMKGESPAKVAAIIRPGGLAKIKADRILGALDFIERETGKLDLSFLGSMSPGEVDAWLARIKGVGPKTRSIVMLFSLDMPTFPVDTHIHRVAKRLGLIGSRTSREKAQEEMARLVPSTKFYNFHINIIEHGRAVCKARKPRCTVCSISRLCDYYSTKG